MFRILIPVSALLLSDALLLVGHGLLLTFLPVAGLKIGFTDTEIALTGSAYFLGFVGGCLLTPRVVKRVGHIRSFAVLATSYSAVVLVFPFLSSLYAWLLLRFLVGLGIAGLYMIIESWLNERANLETRGTILSVYTVINLLMMTVGQQLLSLLGADSQHLFALAAILLSLAIIPVSLTLSLAPAPLDKVSINLSKIWNLSHVGLSGAVIGGLVTGAFWSLGPVYARSQGFDTFQLTMFMSAVVVGGAVFQLPIGRISDRLDRRVVVFYCALLASVISILMVFLPIQLPQYGNWSVIFLATLWGGTVMTQYAICLAHANDAALPEEFVMVGSGMLLTLGFCSALGAPLASFTMKGFGAPGLFVFSAICMLAYAIAIAIRRSTHSLPADTPSEPFRATAETITPAVYEMDPRSEE